MAKNDAGFEHPSYLLLDAEPITRSRGIKQSRPSRAKEGPSSSLGDIPALPSWRNKKRRSSLRSMNLLRACAEGVVEDIQMTDELAVAQTPVDLQTSAQGAYHVEAMPETDKAPPRGTFNLAEEPLDLGAGVSMPALDLRRQGAITYPLLIEDSE